VKILAIETSTRDASVALLRNGEIVFDESFVTERAHSVRLFVILQSALRKAGSIDRIAVGLGPGSYAGVRIAIAAAIGLQFACAAALVGLPSVATFDLEVNDYCAIGDARRDTYYFTHVRDGLCAQGPLLMSEEELRTHLAAFHHAAVFSSDLLPHFPQTQRGVPSARRLAILATREGAITQRDALEPVYLREPHITKPRARDDRPS
jgi:tRNA threonylcarbamoyl adenosine modification protein YeaZ